MRECPNLSRVVIKSQRPVNRRIDLVFSQLVACVPYARFFLEVELQLFFQSFSRPMTSALRASSARFTRLIGVLIAPFFPHEASLLA